MKTLLFFPLLLLPLAAADLTGKWLGTVEIADPSTGSSVLTNVRAAIRQSGSSVAVRIGRKSDAETEGEGEGSLEGKVLTFAIRSPEGKAPFRFRLVLTDAGNLEGTVEGVVEEGRIAGKVKLAHDVPK